MVISTRTPTGEGGSNYLQYFILRGFIFKSRFVLYNMLDIMAERGVNHGQHPNPGPVSLGSIVHYISLSIPTSPFPSPPKAVNRSAQYRVRRCRSRPWLLCRSNSCCGPSLLAPAIVGYCCCRLRLLYAIAAIDYICCTP